MDESTRLRALTSLRAHIPARVESPVVDLGHGIDHTAFLAGDLVLRVADGRAVTREARLLDVVARRVALPVPAPRFVDEDCGVLAYPLIPGRSLLGRHPAPGAATRLGRFLHDLHGIDPATVTDLVPAEDADPGEWLAELDGPATLLQVLRDTMPPPGRRRVLAHADLGAEHILELDGQITGVIDWSDAAITDPALDFARLYRDFGPAFLAETLQAYGGLGDDEAATMARIAFFARCAAVEDLTYGCERDRPEYLHAAQQSIRRLFRHAD